MRSFERPCLALLFSLLVGIPSVAFAVTAQPQGAFPSVSGAAQLIGRVNVLNLSEAPMFPGTSAVRSMPFLVPNTQGLANAKSQVLQEGYVVPGNNEKKIVLVPDAPAPQTVTVDLKITGVSGNSPNPCACSPPDVASAVGPNHVVEFVNTAGKIWNKAGTVVKNTFALSGFFLLPSTHFVSDPYVVFDSASGRWFASILDVTADKVQFAVSTTNDPTGTFMVYSVTGPPPTGGLAVAFPDQPFIGTDADKLGIAANQFSCTSSLLICNFDGTEVWILNLAQLTAGASTVNFSFFSPDPTVFTLRPVRHLSSITDFYLVSNCKNEVAPFNCVSSPNEQTHSLVVDVVDGVPGVSTVTLTSFLLSGSIATSTVPPGAQQRGTSIVLNTNDNRILSAVWQSNSLWLSFTDACVPSGGDTTTRSCGRLDLLTTSGASVAPTVSQDFDFSTAFKYVFYPAVSVDSNVNLVVVYGRSSSSEYPSVRDTGRMATAAPLTLQASVLVIAGTKPDTVDQRWGDYFSASTDPSSSPTSTSSSKFWIAGEFRTSSVFQSWSTELAAVHFTP